MSNPTALPDLYFYWSLLLGLLSLAELRVLFVSSYLLFRSDFPITDRVWKGTGSLKIVSEVLTRPHLTKNCRQRDFKQGFTSSNNCSITVSTSG